MAKIILRAGKVAIKIIMLFAIFGLIACFVKVIIPAQAEVVPVGDVSAQLEQAETYVAQDQYDQATAIYNSIIADSQVNIQGQVFARGGLIVVSIHRIEITAAEAALESLKTNYPNEVAVSSAVFDAAHAFSPTRPDKAITLFQQILDTWPNCEDAIRAQVSLVRENLALNNELGAESAYQELLTKFSGHPDMSDAVFTIADAYVDSNPQKSLELYQEVVEKWPNSVEVMRAQVGVVRANLLLNNEAAAESAYQELVAKFPGHPDMYDAVFTIADAYVDLNPQKTIELYEYAMSTWPDNKDAIWAGVGIIRTNIALGNDPNVPEAVDELLKQFSESELIAEAVLSIADNYYDVRKYENSLELYEYVMSTWPDDKDAVRAGAGIIRSNIGLGNELDVPEAIDELRAQFSGSEFIAEAVFNIAGIYYDVGKYENALDLYQYTLNTFPDCRDEDVTRARAGIIRANIALGDETSTQKDLDELVAEFANSPGLPEELCIIGEDYGVKAYELKSQGLETEAKEYFQNAVSVWERVIHEFPDCDVVPRAYYCSAGCYELELSEYEKAIEYYQKILDNWPYFDYRRASYAQFGIARCNENLEKSGQISSEEAATGIRQACNNLLANYPETNPAILHAAHKLLDEYHVSE